MPKYKYGTRFCWKSYVIAVLWQPCRHWHHIIEWTSASITKSENHYGMLRNVRFLLQNLERMELLIVTSEIVIESNYSTVVKRTSALPVQLMWSEHFQVSWRPAWLDQKISAQVVARTSPLLFSGSTMADIFKKWRILHTSSQAQDLFYFFFKKYELFYSWRA